MIEQLFGSKTRVKLLQLFYSNFNYTNCSSLNFKDTLQGIAHNLQSITESITCTSRWCVDIHTKDHFYCLQAQLIIQLLSANSVGGYLESFTTVHPCHFCMVSRDKFCSTLHSNTRANSTNYDNFYSAITQHSCYKSAVTKLIKQTSSTLNTHSRLKIMMLMSALKKAKELGQ